MTSISIQNVTKKFGSTAAVEDVTITIPSGAFVSLLGPSGCGKTTLLRLIAGLEAVTSGRIGIGERDITDMPPERRGLGMMFQSYALFPHMSVIENVRFPLRMRAAGSKAEQIATAESALGMVQLKGLGDRMPASLSGGQQQRVALARALVAKPHVLLLDEALSNLDARLREEMQIELKELHSNLGITTLFVTHDQSEALSLSDTVVLMRNGKVEQIGAPDHLYENPGNIFAADFVGSANLIEVRVSVQQGCWTAALPDGTLVRCEPPASQQPGIYRLSLRQEDLSLSTAPARDGEVAIPATAITSVYLGDRHRTLLEVGGARVRCLSVSGRPPAPGRQILKWEISRARLLSE